jgi:hypothetical protein
MYNEDTGEEITCPHCGSDEKCAHLLILLDLTFGECMGGYAFNRYDEFEKIVQEAFVDLLEGGAAESISWSNPEIAELWSHAMEQYNPGDGEVWLYSVPLNSLISEVLSARHDAVHGVSDDASGGSVLVVFYVLEPQKALEAALSDLRRLMQSALTGAGAGQGS